MIITDRFVVLNNPRTGSTFVRTVLKRLHEDPAAPPLSRRQRLLHRLGVPGQAGLTELLLRRPHAVHPMPPDQHGAFCQIPPRHRNKEVVSVVRDPCARLLSIYRFGWWQRYPPVDSATLARHFPGFPHLSFEEYVRLEELAVERRLPGRGLRLQVGRQTIRFIEMFFRDPQTVLRRLDEEYLSSDCFRDDLPPIRFLQTEQLNRDLHDFLRGHGYAAERVAFVLKHERVNTTPGAEFGWSAELLERIRHKERLLFRILRHLGFEYGSALQPRSQSPVQRSAGGACSPRGGLRP